MVTEVSVSLKRIGSVSEWLKELVLKTSEPQGSVGSNPTASANLKGSKMTGEIVVKDHVTAGNCTFVRARKGEL